MAPRQRLRTLTSGILLSTSLTLLGQAVQAASGGALPRGDDSSPVSANDAPPSAGRVPTAVKVDKAAKKPVEHHNCLVDLNDPPGGTGHFSPDGTSLYLLTQVSPQRQDQAPSAKIPDATKVKYSLLKITPKARKAESVVSFEHLPNAQLMTFGNPLKAATIIAFSGKGANCYEGPAATIGLSFDKTTDKAVSAVGQYELVNVPDGRVLVDLKKNIILDVDPLTFQAKTARKVPPGERALYFDAVKKQLVTWLKDGDNRGLAAYNGDDDKAPVRLPIKYGDRVVQDGSLFGIVRTDQASNSLDLEEVLAWSGSGTNNHYKLVVPPAFPVTTAGISVNFKHHIALVFGASYAAKLKWQRVFVYDYAAGSLLGVVAVSGNQYVNFAEIDATGSVAVLEVRDGMSRQTVAARIFDIAKKSFNDLDLAMNKGAVDSAGPKP